MTDPMGVAQIGVLAAVCGLFVPTAGIVLLTLDEFRSRLKPDVPLQRAVVLCPRFVGGKIWHTTDKRAFAKLSLAAAALFGAVAMAVAVFLVGVQEVFVDAA
jgi:hypothetical protein